MVELILAALLLGNPVLAKDTLFDLREGDRIVLPDFSGELTVSVWDRSTMSLETDSDEETSFEFHRSGSQVVIRVLDRKRRNRAEDLLLRVPSWVDLDLTGRRLDAVIRGVEGDVNVRSLQGDLTLRDLRGEVDAGTANGEIHARGLDGRARLQTGSDELTVRESSGSLELESVSGDIELMDVSSGFVSARTTSGDIDFSGRFIPTGEYEFRTHSGDLTLNLLEGPDLNVSVLAYEGEFQSDFPIRTRGFRSGQEMEFTLGAGGGRLILEAFSGEISLLRGER